jgi:hypothetical protein
VSKYHISDEAIHQLLTGEGTEDIYVGDASDLQLYGRRHLRKLSGSIEQSAIANGFETDVYQSIYWWTFAYFPVIPTRSYIVLRYSECKEDPGYDKYRGLPVPTDRTQEWVYFAAGMFVLFATVALAWWWSSRNNS